MLIASKFRDYYDSITSFGVDKTVVYNRVRQELPNKPAATPYFENFVAKKTKHEFQAHKYIVGFCGKIYPVVEIRRIVRDKNSQIVGKFSKFLYDQHLLTSFVLSHGGKIQSRGRIFWRNDYHIESEKGMTSFFDPSTWKQFEKAFHEHKVPAFVIGRLGETDRNELLILNPRLKDFSFFKVKDTVTAFQDLYMFISGVLGVPERPMVEVSDKTKAAKKGHDGKYSFRKPPSKKRRTNRGRS